MINDIKELGLFKAIKYAWQRVFKGYDETLLWDMNEYMNYYFIPAIKDFCEESIKYCKDERFVKIYTIMLEKILTWEKYTENQDWTKSESSNAEMWSYFGQNIGYFWD